MRKIASMLLTTAAAGAAVALTAGTASAATVTVSNPNASGAYTATSTSVTLSDGGVNMTCTGSAGAGTILSGTYTTPADIGTITSLNYTGCTGPLGAVTTTVNSLPYHVFIGAPGTPPTGYISGANVHVSMPLCSFDVTGAAPGKYVNGTSNQLQLTPTVALPTGVTGLTVGNVSGCAGLVHNGDHPTYTANYTVSPNITVS